MSLPSTTPTAFSIDFDNVSTGNSEVSAEVDNTANGYAEAIVYVEITSGTSAPTAGQTYDIFLVRSDNHASDPIRDDDWAGTKGSFNHENAPHLGSIVVTASTSKEFRGIFSTRRLGPLGPMWGIAFTNNSGATTSTSASSSFARYLYVTPDAPA